MILYILLLAFHCNGAGRESFQRPVKKPISYPVGDKTLNSKDDGGGQELVYAARSLRGFVYNTNVSVEPPPKKTG